MIPGENCGLVAFAIMLTMGRKRRFAPAIGTILAVAMGVPVTAYTGTPGLKPAAGRLLVANPRLADANFGRSVVLLITYDKGGSMGVILNRPTAVKLESVLPDIKELQKAELHLYAGGPVAINRMLMLVRADKPPKASLRVLDDIFVGGERDTLRPLVQGKGAARRFRVFAGHAGWAPGQLDAEIARGDWFVTGADAALILDTPPDQMWQRLMDRLSGDWADARQVPGPIPVARSESRPGLGPAIEVAGRLGPQLG